MALVLAIIQARVASTRLPGKVLMDLSGKPVLWHIVNRIKKCKRIDHVIVATSVNSLDKDIVDFCHQHSVEVFAGSEHDVLERFYDASVQFGLKNGDSIVRITADCPIIDPFVVDTLIDHFNATSVDYASNINPPTFPDGLDAEALTFEALCRAHDQATLLSEREHVTLFIRNRTDLFKHFNLENEQNLAHHRWTLDEPEDYTFIKTVYDALYKEGQMFFLKDVLQYLEMSPGLSQTNSAFLRNEGLIKSLKNDGVAREKKSGAFEHE